MMQTATSRYAHMTREELIEALEHHDQTLQSIYNTVHLSNKKMAPGEKLFWIGARCVLAGELPNEHGLVRLPTDKVAEFIGMSESSASRYASDVIERYEATKVPVPYTTKKGQDRILTYIDKSDPVWNEPWAVNLTEEKERTINGNGKYCEHCKTYNLQVKTQRLTYQEIQECECCGYKKVSAILTDKDKLDPMEYIPEKKGPQAGEPFAGEEKGLGICIPYDPLTQAHAEAEEKKVSRLESLSLESWLAQRIGHGQVIVSTGNLEEPKYITKPAGYTPDLAAYLQGKLNHLYGSRPALPNGTTYLLGFDLDAPELDKKHRYMMFRLALAGIASAYWKRRPGRGHLEVYTDAPVDRRAFYAHLLRICPDLAAIPECFPVGSDQNTGGADRADFGYSWPLWYRIDDQVYECAADFMFPDRPGELVSSPGIKSDRAGLAYLIAQTITPASLIPALPAPEQVAPQEDGGVLVDKPLEVQPSGPYSDADDLAPVVLAAINERLTWEDIAALCGGLHRDRFRSPTHDEDKPSVVIRGKYASDFGRTPSGRPETRDKFGWWCAARGLDQTAELNRLITEYKHKGQVAS